jgi:hypothetical protein
VSPKIRSEMSESEEKINDSDYHVREMCVTESLMLVLLNRGTYIYGGSLPEP